MTLVCYRRELADRPDMVDAVLSRHDVFPPVAPRRERIIRTSRHNAERAVCRAIARRLVYGGYCTVEVVR